ncbi:MAG TPA: pectate lyase [Tepidisphaeraceae bacterium]|nr:pectate lyase [Tepidisphaeraceae bacterium]
MSKCCRAIAGILSFTLFFTCRLWAQAPSTAPAINREKAVAVMKQATEFMMNRVGYKGGFVWSYTADRSRRWGEMEAFPTMMWMQGAGSNAMGQVLLDLYHATHDEYYYQAAAQVADAVIRAQHPAGGWNYVYDLAGEESLKKWYDTIGKNGWRLEEFQHYYGNATFDDSVTTDTARFMLRMYLEKKEAKYKSSLDKAVQFVLDSQYPVGGWPQRYPPAGRFEKNGLPDYTGDITFNDEVNIGNIDLLVLCYRIFGDAKFLEAARRGMNVFVETQQPQPQAGWGLQYDPKTLKPAGARSYEPKSLVTTTTVSCINEMIRFYYLTGDRKFLARLSEAIDWLDTTRLPPNTGGRGSHARFAELGTNKPLFVHRRGSNVVNGQYYVDYDPANTIGHYSSFASVDTDSLRAKLKQAMDTPPDQAIKDSPLRPDAPPIDLAKEFANRGGAGGGRRGGFGAPATPEQRAAQLAANVNAEGFWPAPLSTTSNPYKGDGPREIPPGDFGRTNVGDEYDTSPYGTGFGRGGQGAAVMGISTQMYINNMRTFIAYLEIAKP